jgi:hypothetical protein
MVVRQEYDYPLPVQRPCSSGDKFIYIDYVNDELFDVGMGNWVRVRNPDRNDCRVQMLCNRHPKDRWVRRVVARNLSTQDAFNLEHTLILCYGRKDLGTGILFNKNNGIGTDPRKVSSPGLSVSKPLLNAGYSSCLLSFFGLLFIVMLMGLAAHSSGPTRGAAVSPSTPAPTRSEKSDLAPTPTPAPTVTPKLIPTATPNFKDARWPDGRMLSHPDHFVQTGVVNVARDDKLELRTGPGTRFGSVTKIPAGATGILAFDRDAVWDGDTWWYPIEWQGFRDYVGGHYLPHNQ